MNRGAHFYHEDLCTELINYLKSQYLGKSEVLLDACEPLLYETGVLFSEPYIESSPAYATIEDGIGKSSLPFYLISFFEQMINAGLGVYKTPFRHQVEALEHAWKGHDLFVSTGTGSGKTECFMWPLLAKLTKEAKENPDSWHNLRGVRAIVMYPMNALVSDQISRLRRLLGDPEEKFIKAFRDTVGHAIRRPQFGMYTGRTPYAGTQPESKQDSDLAKSLESVLARDNEDYYFKQLLHNGKIPSKKDLCAFIDNIRKSVHEPNPDDAEMVTRFEMQKICPDILITNYSMMEYMLLRPRESNIWKNTKLWLDSNPYEKLLFIIDEAHMYRGSAGGEVALLLRRLFYKLGISRERVQFILTTASMPHKTDEDKLAVDQFACSLTASKDAKFTYIWGYTDTRKTTELINISEGILAQVNVNDLDNDEYARLKELNRFRSNIARSSIEWDNLPKAYQWLNDNLGTFTPFNKLFEECRGKAISISNLATKIFPEANKDLAISAIDAMLTIAPMARDWSGSVLFPARMHMLFRGFRGVYACTNPNCPNHHTKNGITLGDVQLVDAYLICPRPNCSSRVYELYNDRRCGALFFHGYVQQCTGRQYLWTSPGAFFDVRKMMEIHLYIPMKQEKLPPKKKGAKNPFKLCYLDYASGYITFDDSAANKVGYRPLWYSEYKQKGKPDTLTFSTCPKCRQQLTNARITNFSTKGNQAFFNVIREQFLQQPAAYMSDEDHKRFPNQGRKVLLFSDSRQRAATLARDMTLASDEMSARQLFMLALQKIKKVEEKIDDDLNLNDVYGYFVQAAVEHNVSLFSNESKKIFEDHKLRLSLANTPRRNGKASYPHTKMNFNDAPQDMQEHLLKMFCSRYNNLPDAGLCYFEPAYEPMYIALELLKKSKIDVSEEKFIEFFSAILHVFLSDNVALGHQILDERRRNVRREYEPFGCSDCSKLPNVIAATFGISDDLKKQLAWMDAFKLFCNSGQHDQVRYFLNMERLHPVYDHNHTWYRCGRCAAVSPFMLNDHCPVCGEDALSIIEDFSPEAFWRENAEHAVNGGVVRVIDTEEHTAQLGHKDQRSEMWAKTERYEMRFQDMIEEGETSVDILSSTTTMEVGIDIGSLVAVGLRNMPPTRENYQQRAGRAGRRGTSMSTIVTFAEGGPHDTYYFNKPEPIFQGEPSRPWIDVNNEKLLTRHLNMIALNAFMNKCTRSLDELATIRFFESYFDELKSFLLSFSMSRAQVSILVPKEYYELFDDFRPGLIDSLNTLAEKVITHKDAYGDGLEEKQQKKLLDALYEEGVIPTYSFPKDVVSTYIENERGIIEYKPDRGLDLAISEYAPGRTIVVDKKTYQIGGLYIHTSIKAGNPFEPARAYIEDPNYCKGLKRCNHCGWFGFADEMKSELCPFCSSDNLVDMRPMVRPWGFSPINGEPILPELVDMQYTSAETPLYSSLPNDNMDLVEDCRNIRVAKRANQRIIMINEGSMFCGERQGFIICAKCGAAAPGSEANVLSKIRRPGNQIKGSCKHRPFNANLGYDFVTDMLVLEITLPKSAIEVDTADSILWRTRAATTLAEALRLTASRILDIEFTDIQAGYRTRYAEDALYMDIYLYDSLSSGAGYSSRIADYTGELLQETLIFLSECNCDKACNNCLKHYRNQYLQNNLDRFAALQLLEWGMREHLPEKPAKKVKEQFFNSINRLLHEEGIRIAYDAVEDTVLLSYGIFKKECVVYAAMKKLPHDPQKIYVTEEAITDAKPFAIDIIKEALGLS